MAKLTPYIEIHWTIISGLLHTYTKPSINNTLITIHFESDFHMKRKLESLKNHVFLNIIYEPAWCWTSKLSEKMTTTLAENDTYFMEVRVVKKGGGGSASVPAQYTPCYGPVEGECSVTPPVLSVF